MKQEILQLSAKVPVMLMGAPGIGKTAVVSDFAKNISADLIDVRLSAETPGSFEGKDYVCPREGNLKKARSWWLQRLDRNKENNTASILFFDEYTNAPDALQQLAYSPFNERRLHGVSFDYELTGGSPGLYVFAAGNRVEDETGAREVVHASKTRVFTLDFPVSANTWLKWAEKNDIHKKIRTFIFANPDALLEKPSTGTACPRGWVNLSTAIKMGIDYKDAAKGTVNGAHLAKFCTFWGDSDTCPTISEIVSGRAKKPKAVHLTAYSVTLAFALKDDPNAAEHIPHVFRWIGGTSKESLVVFARYVTQLMPEVMVSDKECREVLKPIAEKMVVKVL